MNYHVFVSKIDEKILGFYQYMYLLNTNFHIFEIMTFTYPRKLMPSNINKITVQCKYTGAFVRMSNRGRLILVAY